MVGEATARLVLLAAILGPLTAYADEQRPENLKTLHGTVIEKPWTKSYESWNAGGSEYYVLDVGQTQLPQGSRSAREGVILRPSGAVPFEKFKKFKGKKVIVKGRFVEAQPYKPTHPNEQMPGDQVEQYAMEPTVVDGPDGKPILGPRRPASRGSGFQVYEILSAKQSDVAPKDGLSDASISTEQLRRSLKAAREELRRREMGEGPRWTIPTDLLRKRLQDYEGLLQAREAVNTRQAPQSTEPPDSTEKDIVPGVRAGKFVLGQRTLADLLGNDTPEAGKRFADDGVWFQFQQGKVLTGVTIRSDKYATVEGLRVGSTTDEVIAVFGQPGDAKLTLKKGDRPIGELPALVYEGITFLTASGKVEAIHVTKKNQLQDDDASWSKESGGLAGRLVVAKPKISRPLQLQVGLELRSIHYGGGPWMAVQSGNPFLFEMQVTDANGKPVPPTMQRVDVIYSPKWLIVRPWDRLTIPLTIESLDGARGSHLDTTTRIWKLPPGKYRLAGTFSAPQEDRYEGKEATPWTGTLELPPVEVEILPDLPVDRDTRNASQRTVDEGHALGILETFLGALASKDFKAAYGLVAPSSKMRGDPIAYRAPLDYKTFLGELSPHVEDDAAPSGGLRKFMGYELGDRHWESADCFRVLVTFQGWDRDEVLIVRENGKWYVADPIHIIR